MSLPPYLEVQSFLNGAITKGMPKLKVSILRNVMMEPIEPYLRYLSYQSGFEAHVVFGEYDNILQEALGANSQILNQETDCVLVFAKLENLSPQLALSFASLDSKDLSEEVSRIEDFIRSVLKGIRTLSGATILWHSFEVPALPALGIRDNQVEGGQVATIGELNSTLRTALRQTPNAYFVDLNLCLVRVGSKSFYDLRYWHIGRAPYTRQALSEIALEDFKFIRALKGKSKKCLVLDCDNVLWGGIVGEDGLAGICLGKTHPGSAYYEFQQEVLNLYNRGIILALCSKNEAESVWEVFERHPDMVLKKEHIATAEINWQDKPANLRKIASDLNIGLDSLVFVDDSAFEAHLVQDVLPDVEVILMPKDRAVEYRDIIAGCSFFDTLTLSEEDKKRGVMYRTEASRKKLQAQATDMKAFYESLAMALEVSFADELAIPRISQLTQKTNQFNLTTRRYSDSDIINFAESEESDVIYIKLRDRFGDSGIVGVCILKYNGDEAVFDTLLLSCRVLGRGVEDAFLVQALELAVKRGCLVAIGEYYPSRKNCQVREFYPKHGFVSIEKEENGEGKVFQFRLEQKIPLAPKFFKEIRSPIHGKGVGLGS